MISNIRAIYYSSDEGRGKSVCGVINHANEMEFMTAALEKVL